MEPPVQKVILIAGPTASGKSDFGQFIALENHGEIINYDSQQFYRGLDVGTGKVPLDARKVPHWLLDIIDPGNYMTAMEFARQAAQSIEDIQGRGRVPILVGGTGLYLRALLEGLDPLPSRNPEIRKDLQLELELRGPESLYNRLKKLDPASAGKISPKDSSRLIRFLEIHELSGKAPSSLMKRGRAKKLKYEVKSFWLQPERNQLRVRIAERVAQMLAQGWEKEVRHFMEEGQDPRDWENKPIGYGDLAAAMDQNIPIFKVQQDIVLKTQRYAKRQDTFFRGLFSNPAYQSDNSSLKIIKEFGTKSGD